MYRRTEDGQILKDHVRGAARIGSHYTWDIHVHASLVAGVLRAEYRHPVIPDTEWQGQSADEERPLLLTVDDSEPVEIPVSGGVAEIPIEFDALGTYRLRIEGAGFGTEPAELEVAV